MGPNSVGVLSLDMFRKIFHSCTEMRGCASGLFSEPREGGREREKQKSPFSAYNKSQNQCGFPVCTHA